MSTVEIKKTIDRFKRFFTRDRKLMLLSVFFAFLVWIPSKLNKTYHHELDIPLTIEPPDHLSISYSSDHHVMVRLSGTGARLIGLRRDIEDRQFVIDVDDARQDIPYLLSPQVIAKALRDSLHLSDQVNIDILGTGITYRFDALSNKRVPLVLRHDIKCLAGYGLSGYPGLTIEEVAIKGPAAALATIDTMYTETIKLHDIHQSQSIIVPIDRPNGAQVMISPTTAEAVIKVAPLVDKTLSVSLPAYQTTHHAYALYPDHIEVHLAVPAPMATQIKAEDVDIEYVDMGTQTLLVEVLGLPSWTNYISHTPRLIRYFEESSEPLNSTHQR